jgi:glucose/arabinose dehydrogenase
MRKYNQRKNPAWRIHIMKKIILKTVLTLGAMAAALMPIRANANPGDIYVSVNNNALNTNGAINDYAPNGKGRVFASGLNGPRGIIFDGAGNLFASIGYAGTVVKFVGGTPNLVASGLGFPEGLGFDSNGNLYVADSGGTLYEIAPDGTVSTVFSITGAFFFGVAVDGANNVYVADAVAGIVYKFTGTLSTFASVAGATGLAFDSAGNLSVSTQCESFPFGNCSDPTIGGRIVKITPDGTQTTFVSGVGDGDLRGLDFDAFGNLFVADLAPAPNKNQPIANVYKITPTGSVSVFTKALNSAQSAEFVTVQP